MRLDRREHPRVRTSQILDIVVADGAELQGKLLDISRAGLQFCCDGPTARNIFPGGQLLSVGKSGTIRVCCKLEFIDQSIGSIDAECQVVFSRRAAQDRYYIGVQFEQLGSDSYGTIERYINEHLA